MYILIHRELAKRMEASMDFVRNRLSDAGVIHSLNFSYNGRLIETDDRSLTVHFVCGNNSDKVVGIRADYYISDTPVVNYYLKYRCNKQLDNLWQACDLVIDYLKENYLVKKNCFWYEVCKDGLKTCTDGCKDCGFYKIKSEEGTINCDAITSTGVYDLKPTPKTKTYLQTYNPYMSEDWKNKFFDKFTEQYMDTDVNSMYPAYFVPARGSAKTSALTKELLRQMSNSVYGRNPAQNQLKVKLEAKRLCDTLDAARYSFEAFRVAMERIDEAQKEAIVNYYKCDVEETTRLYNAFKEKEKENMNYLANELNKTNGAAILEVSGNRYRAKVHDITMKSGELTTLTVAVDDDPNNYLRTTREPATRRALPAIENVIFNDPATIVFWSDGTKTVVKAQDEPFDPEKGLAMAISKKALGNQGRYFETFKKWLPDNTPASTAEALYGRE